ncbi:hypothetical protein EII17_04635 [Clostridiales bacterium COT073_COT-073]|nr:hypothetical protein EII17_04635 [Clostridiales bacterium COT073_COT-073]
MESQEIKAIPMNPSETKEQILEYMKFRGPALIATNLYSRLKSIQDVIKSGEKVKQRLETEKSNGSFLDALNQYRYFLHGWKFQEDQPGYKYIAKDLGAKTGGYFVRALIDYVSENPYRPYIDMADPTLFQNARSHFDVEGYAGYFEGTQYAKLGYDFVLATFTDQRAFDHDQQQKALLAEKRGQLLTVVAQSPEWESLEKQIEAMEQLNVYHFYHSLAPDTVEREKYNNISKPDHLKKITVFFKHYADYYNSKKGTEKPQPENEEEQNELATEWMSSVVELNEAMLSDVRWLKENYRLTREKYAILDALKRANEKAKKSLANISGNLQSYEKKVLAEIDSLKSETEVKDANYAAATLPKLEDQLEMIGLIRQQVERVNRENKFDENIALLNQMIQKLCIVGEELEKFRDFEYYTIPESVSTSDFILEYLRTGTFEMIRPIKFGVILDEGSKLAKELGIKRQSTFDKAGFLALQQQYIENCQSLHIDFTKEQLFHKKPEEKAAAQQKAEESSASIGKILGVAGKMFSSISVFGSDKALSQEEYKALPSIAVRSQDDQKNPDGGVFKGNTRSLGAIKKLANTITSWIDGVKNLVGGFKNLVEDPIGVIYVNEYIMSAFYSTVTGIGEYEKQMNLKFQDKAKAIKSEGLKLESEIEYIIGGQKSDRENNKNIAIKILMLRIIPNALYIFTHSETNSLAISIASALTWFFPPLYYLVYVVIIMIWAILESLVDVFVLRQGIKIPFLKGSSDFMLSPAGFKAFADIFGKIVISKGKEAAKNAVDNAVDTLDGMVTKMGQDAKKYIKNKTNELANKLEEKSQEQIARLQDYVTAKYQTVETAVSDFEKSVDNYIETAVGRYFVEAEKYRARGEKMGVIDVDLLFNTETKRAISIAANANMKNVISLVNDKLKNKLSGHVGSAVEIIEQIKQDGGIQSAINAQVSNLRTQAEQKLEEVVFAPLEKDFTAKKDEIKADLQEYLNDQIDLGAEKMQSFYDNKIKNAFSGQAGHLSTEDKSASAFSLGYEDYLRFYLIFTNENDKIFRILDLIQLREQKQISSYMSGVELNAGFKVKYLFLPRLIQIAKKQSNAITVNEDRYKEVDFNLRSVAGY